MRTTLSRAGKSRGHQFAFFGGTLKNGSRDWSADQRGIEQRLGISLLTLSLLKSSACARDFLLSRTDLGQLEGLIQRIYPLLVRFELRGSVIEGLL